MFESLKRFLPWNTPGSGFGSLLSWGEPGSRFDWRQHVGEVRHNAVVSIASEAIAAALADSVLVVQRSTGRGGDEFQNVDNHPLPELFDSTFGGLAPGELWKALVLDIFGTDCGAGYLYIDRSPTGRINGLQYLPADRMELRGSRNNAMEWGWEYTPAGGVATLLSKDQVIQLRLRASFKDPRTGESPLRAVRREIALYNATIEAFAQSVSSGAHKLQILSPTDGKAPGEDQLKAAQSVLNKMSGPEGAGKLHAIPMAANLQSAGFSPKDMEYSTAITAATDAICGAFRVDPMVLGLSSESKTFSNYEEANSAFWRQVILPLQRQLAGQITAQLLRPYFGASTKQRVWFDVSDVRALREDQASQAEIAATLAGAGLALPSELRTQFDIGEEANHAALDAAYLARRAPVPVQRGGLEDVQARLGTYRRAIESR
jgi:HK97 family phage portal protein